MPALSADETLTGQTDTFREPLFPASQNDLWGYISKDGSWAIPPQWRSVSRFDAYGVASVITDEDDERLLLIDQDTNLVLDMSTLGDYGLEFVSESVYFIRFYGEDSHKSPALFCTDTRAWIPLDANLLGFVGPARQSYYIKEWGNSLVISFYLEKNNVPDYHGLFSVLVSRSGNRLSDRIYRGQYLRKDIYAAVAPYDPALSPEEQPDEQTAYRLIDSMGNTVLQGLPHGRVIRDVFVAYDGDFRCTADGKQITETGMYAHFAAQSPWGLYPFQNEKGAMCYLDVNGREVTSLGTWQYASLFDDATGLAWVVADNGSVASLMDTGGNIIHQGWRWHPTTGDEAPCFSNGWLAALSTNGYYNYLRADGTLLFPGSPSIYGEPFRDGLARISFLLEDYTYSYAYIDAQGRVVWAKDGREEWVQQRLDDGAFPRLADITIQDATRILQGFWVLDSGGGADHLTFSADALYSDGMEGDSWRIRICDPQIDSFWSQPPFVLEYWNDGSLSSSCGLEFYSADSFSVTFGEGGGDYSRVTE